jgi:hypothetical protein
MSSHREILAALARLKSGSVTLDPDQYVGLLEAVEQAVEALFAAPRGSDPVATGLWYNHERAPALARLADALSPKARERAAAHALKQQQHSDREVIRELHDALVKQTSR